MTDLTANLDGYTFNLKYEYDTYGRVTGIKYPGRSAWVNYTFNDLDLLQTIPGFVTSCNYDPDNKLTAMALANGITNNYIYDVNDRPTNISAGSLLNLSYDYDAVGNITRINTDYYDYDGLNRLTWYGDQGKTTGTLWSYDGAGNMSEKRKILNGATQSVTPFTYDLANRLKSMGNVTYTNDNAGARIEKIKSGETWSYSYDGESRLVQANKNGVSQVLCFYDGAGMRYKKVENGKTTYYIYSGPNPLMEYTPNDGKYTYRIYAGKQAIAEEKAGVVKFYHKDHLGSTRVVTDASGKKIAEYKFAPYGEKELSIGEGTEYGFTDKTEDVTTGLKYFGARFYDAESCRFITADTYTYLPNDERNFRLTADNSFKALSDDPIKYNQYAYCGNNPIGKVDPDGHFAVAFAVFAVPGVGQVAMAAVATVAVAYVACESAKFISDTIHDARSNSKSVSTSNPMRGAPGSTSRTYGKGNQLKQERTYGPDGYPARDTDYDHDHGHGRPHVHDWGRPKDGSAPTYKDRGPGKSLDDSKTSKTDKNDKSVESDSKSENANDSNNNN